MHNSQPHRRRTAPLIGNHSSKSPALDSAAHVSSYSKHRELGVPRNSCNSPQTAPEIIQVSGQSAFESHKRAIRTRNLLKNSYTDLIKGTKNIDIAAFVQADTPLPSRPSSSPPTQHHPPTIHVTPHPKSSTNSPAEHRYPVKPSLFNSTLSIMKTCRTSTSPAIGKKKVSGGHPHKHTTQRAKSCKPTSNNIIEKHSSHEHKK